MSHNMVLMEQTSRIESRQPKDLSSKGQRGQADASLLHLTTEPKLSEVLEKLEYQQKAKMSEVELV